MLRLTFVSLVWAFSFGLIGKTLSGHDPNFLAAARMLLALIVFLPLTRLGRVRPAVAVRLVAIGALQFGVMYAAYFRSFRWLQGHEVALLTIFTPLFVTLLFSLLSGRLAVRFHLAALLAVAGAAVIFWPEKEADPAWKGALVLQVSNLAFAAGQLLYKRLRMRHPELVDRECFGLLYAGALAVTLAATAFTFEPSRFSISPVQIGALLYLGIVASGLCFFLWNSGATRVNVGALAAFNNLKIPLAVACSLIFFGEEANALKLCVGGALVLGALLLNPHAEAEKPCASRRTSPSSSETPPSSA